MWGEEQWLAGFWTVYAMVKSGQLPWLGSLRFGHPRLSPVRGRQVGNLADSI